MIYFHVGLHKTATTFLQVNVFSNFEDISYMCGWKHTWRDIVDKGLSQSGDVLISEENISGRIWDAGEQQGVYPGRYLEEFKNNMKWLKDNFPDASIILGLRKHSSLIESLYKQYIHEGGTGSYCDTLSIFNSDSMVNIDDFSYRKRIEYLDDLFDQRIFVYFQEDVEENLQSFIDALSLFLNKNNQNLNAMQRKENIGVRRMQLRLLRKLNNFNKWLEEKFSISLNNSLFRKLRVTPRDVCQRYLRILSKIGKEIEYESERIDGVYKDDYVFAREYTNGGA